MIAIDLLKNIMVRADMPVARRDVSQALLKLYKPEDELVGRRGAAARVACPPRKWGPAQSQAAPDRERSYARLYDPAGSRSRTLAC